jgi:hypothetical protein
LVFKTVGNDVGFSKGRNLRPEGLWIALGDFGLSLLIKDFVQGRIARGETSEWLILVSHLSIEFPWIILWTVLVTQ